MTIKKFLAKYQYMYQKSQNFMQILNSLMHTIKNAPTKKTMQIFGIFVLTLF
jgi:hypothetical protein